MPAGLSLGLEGWLVLLETPAHSRASLPAEDSLVPVVTTAADSPPTPGSRATWVTWADRKCKREPCPGQPKWPTLQPALGRWFHTPKLWGVRVQPKLRLVGFSDGRGLGPLKDTCSPCHPLSSLLQAEASRPGPRDGLAVCSFLCHPTSPRPHGAVPQGEPQHVSRPDNTPPAGRPPPHPPAAQQPGGGRQAPGLASWRPGHRSQAV